MTWQSKQSTPTLLFLLLLLFLSATSSQIDVEPSGSSSTSGSSPEDTRTQQNLLFALYKQLEMPDKYDTIHQVVHHFDGRYDEMWNLLTTKYGSAVHDILQQASQHQHTPNGKDFNPPGTPTINLENGQPTTTADELATKKKLKEIDDRQYPWEEGNRVKTLSIDDQQAEMEQEIMDFYSVVEPKKMETAEKLVIKYFESDRNKLEQILVRKYFRRSLYLWMQKGGGYNRQTILDKNEEQLHHPDVVAAAADVSRRDLMASVQEFYRAIRPDLQGDHAKETVDRWSRYPGDLIERLVKKYMPSSGYRWLKRSHRWKEKKDLVEIARKKKNGDLTVDLENILRASGRSYTYNKN